MSCPCAQNGGTYGTPGYGTPGGYYVNGGNESFPEAYDRDWAEYDAQQAALAPQAAPTLGPWCLIKKNPVIAVGLLAGLAFLATR